MRPGHAFQLARNMGGRYVAFRAWHELLRRSGLLRRRFPVNPPQRNYISLAHWLKSAPLFFFADKDDLTLPKRPDERLGTNAREIRSGRLPFFSAGSMELGLEIDWLLNPSNGYRYEGWRHWTEIPDFSPESGDIKYTWEASRFSWLYALIRDDYHNGRDHGAFVFSAIDSWMAHNPVNRGPNWRCSQEISLRTLNWTFALYYYRGHSALTPELFGRMLHVIYWQMRHVYANIHFSRIAVRNNHAITETLMLYLGGLLFPFFPEARRWKSAGKAWFEQEIAYQIYPDGAYLQHSFNYQRVVVQLLSWGISLSRLHGEELAGMVNERAQKTLTFLLRFQFGSEGQLPNYGSNDGALFFPLSSCDYSDYRPQLQGLHLVLHGRPVYGTGPWEEEGAWYGVGKVHVPGPGGAAPDTGPIEFPEGGYYQLRTPDTGLLIRCCSYRDRPAQADNLHLDLWVRGKNVLRDAGTYRYNTDPETLARFAGTPAHNTAGLGEADQMLKGSRFIWYYWTEAIDARWVEYEDHWEFSGAIRAFTYLQENITHQRIVRQFKHRLVWEVEDRMNHDTGLPLRQYWHPAPGFATRLSMEATDESGGRLEPEKGEGLYSAYYGKKEATPVLIFSTAGKRIRTTLKFDA